MLHIFRIAPSCATPPVYFVGEIAACSAENSYGALEQHIIIIDTVRRAHISIVPRGKRPPSTYGAGTPRVPTYTIAGQVPPTHTP